jgi:hypothetical protein
MGAESVPAALRRNVPASARKHALFLFGFQTMITVVLAFNLFAPDRVIRRSRGRFPRSEGGRFAFALLWTAAFVIGTLVRAQAVFDYRP